MKVEHNLTNATVIMLMLAMASALSVVYVKYDSRLKFNQLKHAFSEQDRLGVEWGRLQLEHNTWASSNRIEKLARSNLHLQTPKPEQIVYVTVK